jgi:hypothetical protein
MRAGSGVSGNESRHAAREDATERSLVAFR